MCIYADEDFTHFKSWSWVGEAPFLRSKYDQQAKEQVSVLCNGIQSIIQDIIKHSLFVWLPYERNVDTYRYWSRLSSILFYLFMCFFLWRVFKRYYYSLIVIFNNICT